MTPASNRVHIKPTRVYSCDDLQNILGRTLAEQVTHLAFIRGKYLGATVLHYLEELGRQRVDELMNPKTIDSQVQGKLRKKNDTKSRGNRRSRYYKATEPG